MNFNLRMSRYYSWLSYTIKFYSRRKSGHRIEINTIQYATEILEPHLVSFIYSLVENLEAYQTIEARLRVHFAKLCQECQEYGVTRMDWMPSSSDLNPIEKAWALLKVRLRKPQQSF
jgi:hypothetical protein